MTKLWHVAQSPAPDWRLREWLRREGGIPRMNYELEISEIVPFRGEIRDRPLPKPELAITRDDFDFDFFIANLWMFISEDLIQIMDLHAPDYGVFDIDDQRSEPLPRSKKYRMLEVYASEDATDPDQARFEPYQPYPDRDPMTMLRGVTIRPGFSPKRSLFYDSNTRELFCTDELAVKVLESGCTGMNFIEPGEFQEEQPLIKTLRGVERLMDLNLDTDELITEPHIVH